MCILSWQVTRDPIVCTHYNMLHITAPLSNTMRHCPITVTVYQILMSAIQHVSPQTLSQLHTTDNIHFNYDIACYCEA